MVETLSFIGLCILAAVGIILCFALVITGLLALTAITVYLLKVSRVFYLYNKVMDYEPFKN